MVKHLFLKPLSTLSGLGLILVVGLTLSLAACAPVQPAAAPAAASPTDTPAATEAMTTTQAMTATETTTGTMEMTATETTTGTTEMTATETTTATTETTGTAGTMVMVMVYDSPKLGQILTDDKGMTLYIFDKDAKDKSNCSGGCLKNWPALTVKDEADKVMGDGVTGTFGVIDRGDGTYQVTINGMPLYYYIKDQNPHDEVGQAVGDVWWVVAPDGTKVTKQ